MHQGLSLLTCQLVLLPILFLTPRRAVADTLVAPTNQQLRLAPTTTTCTLLIVRLLPWHPVREVTDTLDIRYSKDWTNGNTGDKRCRRLPFIFLSKRRTDVLPFTAATQRVIFVFQRKWNCLFG